MNATTKRKTSITLTEDTLAKVDKLAGADGNRSAVVERAIFALWQAHLKDKRDQRDLGILNENADRLNEEAEDVLGYQADL